MTPKIVSLILLFATLVFGITGMEPALSDYELAELTRYCKENNVVIKGVPDKRGQENLYTVVASIALRALRYSRINATEIEAVYRLPNENGETTQNKPIVVKLINPWTKLQLLVANELHRQQIRSANDTVGEADLVEINHYEPAECTELMLKNSKRFQFYNLQQYLRKKKDASEN